MAVQYQRRLLDHKAVVRHAKRLTAEDPELDPVLAQLFASLAVQPLEVTFFDAPAQVGDDLRERPLPLHDAGKLHTAVFADHGEGLRGLNAAETAVVTERCEYKLIDGYRVFRDAPVRASR